MSVLVKRRVGLTSVGYHIFFLSFSFFFFLVYCLGFGGRLTPFCFLSEFDDIVDIVMRSIEQPSLFGTEIYHQMDL